MNNKKVKPQKYNYKQYTMILDLDINEEKDISDFLEQHKNKKNNFNDQLKKAMKELMSKSK